MTVEQDRISTAPQGAKHASPLQQTISPAHQEAPHQSASPAAFAVVALLRDPQALARAHDVELMDNHLYVPGKGGMLAVIDVTAPDRPEIVWSAHLGEDAQTVLCRNGHAFVGSRDVHAVDIAEPAAARVCKRLRDRPRIDLINGMISWGRHILYANKAGWIGMVDVSEPTEPVLVGAVDARHAGGLLSPHDIAAYRDCIVVVDQRDGSPFKVRLYRVAASKTGEALAPDHWQTAGAVGGAALNGANRVAIYGDYALVGCNKAQTLGVVDIRDPERPETVQVLPFPGEPCGLVVAGAVLFAAGGRTIQALDLTDPTDPQVLATVESQQAFPAAFDKTGTGATRLTTVDGRSIASTGNAHDLVYADGYLYATAQSDHQVAILRVEDAHIRKLAAQPPVRFGGACIPVHVESPVTMTCQRRVRPQFLLFSETGGPETLLYSTDGSGEVSIASGLARTADGGRTWIDHPANPVLDRIESDWQGRRAFGTALTYDHENSRWVMATVGDDTSVHTPGKRAVGLWFSDDLVDWRQYENNPIITVQTDNALANASILPGPDDPPVGMYVRDLRRIAGVWHALVQWRGDHARTDWSRMTVMQSAGDLTGPWSFRNVCIAPAQASDWFNTNGNLNWSQPVQAAGRWYAACQNGVAATHSNNTAIGMVYSDDYVHWHEFDNPVTDPLRRPDGSPVVASQQFLLPPEHNQPWRILLGARGTHGPRYMYRIEPTS